MDDIAIQKIQISGPTLASLLHRFSSSSGDIHGLLFGHLTFSTPSTLSDDSAIAVASASTSAAADSNLIATITSFLSLPSHLPLPLNPPPHHPSSTLLGWFSGRRKTPLRPSLKDSTTTYTLSSSTSLASTAENSHQNLTLPPSLFVLLTTPFQDQLIHTHEYKAFQYRLSADSFEPKSIDIINIGPSFRSNYGSFTPNSPFPSMPFELASSNAMVEDERSENSGSVNSNNLKDQKALDACADGFEIGRLGKLMGSNAANYSAELEDLYDKMLAKLDGLSKLVDKSSAKVLEQENHNMQLRCKLAGLE